MKKFFLVTSQLSESMLMEYSYMPVDNAELAYGAVHYPVIPVINAYAKTGDAIEVITVTYDTPNCHKNLALLDKELAKVCQEKGVSYTLDSIDVPFDDSIQAILSVYQHFIARVNDYDDLYADITYGSKPMPIVLTMALQYAYRTKKGVSIECVTYGQVSHHEEQPEAKIYDVTALVQLDEIVTLMSESKVSDPATVIKLILEG